MNDTLIVLALGLLAILLLLLVVLLQRQGTQNRKLQEQLFHQQELQLHDLKNNVQTQSQLTQQQLSNMQHFVGESLEHNLGARLNQNFELVQGALEKVHTNMGEMQKLAGGVEKLQDVLMNVKTRGILGEVQLYQIVDDMLPAHLVQKNVATIPGSKEVVECAIVLEHGILLPIDAKFPLTHLLALQQAKDEVSRKLAQKNLVQQLRLEAKTIRTKYVSPPHTSDFAILFVPVETLYWECIQLGLVEILQQESKVILAGPSTLSAILSALAFGFKSIAMQQQAHAILDTLATVQQEFSKFDATLQNVQNRLNQANSELDSLVGVRTRKIVQSLEKLSSHSE
ncbi:MAG: DNA recombination protein RmuC [Erysipelotrichaceae bacterium]